MAQQPVETILVRQLADYLSVPVIVFDPARTVVFYNEPADLRPGLPVTPAAEGAHFDLS